MRNSCCICAEFSLSLSFPSRSVLYNVIINPSQFNALYPGFKFRSAAADQVAYLPLFRELTSPVDDKVLGVSKRELLDSFRKDPHTSIGIIPGGFSEAIFADARNTVEYAYLKGRKGFIKLAIEAKVDIVIVYQFGLNRLYNTPRVQRGFRARLAQSLALPMTIPFGWLGTNQPLDDTNVYTVVDGTPFPASQYSLEEIDKAHADYCAHLKRLYDTYKDIYNEGRPLVFIGKDFHDQDDISKAFRRLGVHTSHVIPGTVDHKQELAQIAEQKKRLVQQKLEALEAQKMLADAEQ
jgi:1-acyl-sn-glycerol-3-phosphate acyltransferase